MPFELWLAFVGVSAVVLAIPGPTILLVLSYSIAHGRQATLPLVAGVALGDSVALSLSLIGLGTLLATSAFWFTVIKWLGGLYLVYLGLRLVFDARRAAPLTAPRTRPASPRRLFGSAFIVTALNPKSVVFFTAFVPQFVTADRALVPQLAILEATFLTLAAISAALWAILAGEMRARFRRPETVRLANRIGGGVMIGAGLLTAAARRV